MTIEEALIKAVDMAKDAGLPENFIMTEKNLMETIIKKINWDALWKQIHKEGLNIVGAYDCARIQELVEKYLSGDEE